MGFVCSWLQLKRQVQRIEKDLRFCELQVFFIGDITQNSVGGVMLLKIALMPYNLMV